MYHTDPFSISLGDNHHMPKRSKFRLFRVFLKFWFNAPKFRFLRGWYVYTF